MLAQPESDFLDMEALSWIEWICEQKGSLNEGGPDLHQVFLEMSSQQMRAVVKATIFAFRLAVSRARTLDELEENQGRRFFRLVSTLLYFVARGNIGFDDDDEPTFFRATGTPPTFEMRKKILGRIRYDHPMHIAIAHDLIEETTSEPSTEGEPVQ